MSPEDLVLTPSGLRFWGARLPFTVGRGGVVRDKREGDGGTPVGTHRIVGCLYRADRGPKPCDWAVPIGPNDLWSDDEASDDYNLMVRRPYMGTAERLARGDPLYDIVLITDWNWPEAQPGRGSAIFIHQWRGPGRSTEGCVAVSRRHLRWIVPRINHGTRLIVPDTLAR
ncbi:L,D-transpeptidase family protein [Jannaschia sp. CCS1]|uniref:L,D-transpeptidase family protein n=1 Tax=Jannaschia sp. (strain CCS1) TaxID=290400 RepID=UPI00031D4C9F|nr:L,D-transpeptidase family protein [Jannaschia sp. CCS1]